MIDTWEHEADYSMYSKRMSFVLATLDFHYYYSFHHRGESTIFSENTLK